ncbi:MAG: histidine--tRNA ligase [Spiroplasma poulsonii]|uniref:Histidine--tRNA ligase n=1 Tax=Spiroplasma poulsonii TaxID=2138 RepID=A0A2P6FD22_9MOLU|nr:MULTISPECIES: histidine--tRNA ligase [Spiroplasma]KAF0850993.1 Histidine--tRNA ligase [Spiroplasma poulsonii]MBH8622924.1 histidine--tRNA ligase [Spiroplasma sp. hyd1]MBW1241912.1 histidine--tRNA ligase [Spiroplasma poulsonii]PQM31363.1 Histidine--tRNA ligase [Spiroplasma poulsonii]PWF96371.1 Histidine--tRNA ligase [Spiroplasma poulsonii]
MNIQKPRGTEDIYYEKASELSALELILRDIVMQYNYHEIRTPIFEAKDLFVRAVGNETDIVTKEMFELLDKKEREFVLRPEATVPVIRSILEDKLYGKYELPLKLFYLGSMFRYERPQHGRLRQFNQFGVEVVGVKNYLLDVEVILLGYNLLKALGLSNLTLKLNYLAVGAERTKYIAVLKTFLKTQDLCADCAIRVKKNPLRVLDCKIDNKKFDQAPKIYDYLTESDQTEFNNLQNILTKLAIPFVLDHKLVRGLDYYTSLVFEVVVDKQERELTLLGGGRYDQLVNSFEPSLDYPAVGFALGLERLLLTLTENEIKLADEPYLDVYLICLSDHARYFASSLLLLLRGSGFRADCDYLSRSVKAQFKSLERLKAKNAIIIGDEELKKNVVKIKNQTTGKEQEVKFEKIITFLSKENK